MRSVDLADKNLNSNELKATVDELTSLLESQKYQSRVANSSNKILKALSRGASLDEVLTLQCLEAEELSPGMHASILRLDREKGQLFHQAAISISQDYLNAINGVEIGPEVGSCGRAACLNEQVIVEDINTHPSWQSFKDVAIDAGLQACWSQPINDSQGKVYGTFAMYYEVPQSPCKRDLEFIETQAQISALVFEHHEMQAELMLHQEKLSELVAEKTLELKTSHEELQTTQKQLFEAEKYTAMNEMVAGLAHEINTPLGIAVTSLSMAKDRLDKTISAFQSTGLKKSDLIDCFDYISESHTIGMNSLNRASEIVNDFKSVAVDLGSNEYRTVELKSYIKEVMHTISPTYKRLPFNICSSVEQKIEIYTHPGSIFQVISNLVHNAIKHALEGRENGFVCVLASPADTGQVMLEIKDNGKGMSQDVAKNVFTPFYTTKRNEGGSGLGLSIVHNIVTQKLKGSISLDTEPDLGTSFKILLPDLRENKKA